MSDLNMHIEPISENTFCGGLDWEKIEENP